ncbi:hypothetical protein GCM10023321_78220 [Pseudonocardia eucalypti]|uniref:Uncharacterized protein n=1 Tax=Pseudonocardia eucalypti TaxID=648755 RepID=A0ABP9RD22_9PSEU
MTGTAAGRAETAGAWVKPSGNRIDRQMQWAPPELRQTAQPAPSKPISNPPDPR